MTTNNIAQEILNKQKKVQNHIISRYESHAQRAFDKIIEVITFRIKQGFTKQQHIVGKCQIGEWAFPYADYGDENQSIIGTHNKEILKIVQRKLTESGFKLNLSEPGVITISWKESS